MKKLITSCSSFALGLGLALTTHARPIDKRLKCEQIPPNWQPAIQYRLTDGPDFGIIYFEVSQNKNKATTSIERLHYATHVEGKVCQFLIRHSLDLSELRTISRDRSGRRLRGYTLTTNADRPTILIYSDNAGAQGGTIEITVMREANVFAPDIYGRPFSFEVTIENGAVTAKRKAKWFNVLLFSQTWKFFITKGTISAGVSHVSFLANHTDIGEGYLP